MKRHFYWLLGLFLLVFGQVSAQPWDWVVSSHRFGPASFSDNRVIDMAVNASGNVFAIGTYTAGIGIRHLDMSGGAVSPFFTRFDTNGFPIWLKNAQSPSWVLLAKAVAVDQHDNTVSSGDFSDIALFDTHQIHTTTFQYDGWLAKMDPNGNWLWAKGFGGDSVDRGDEVAIDANDNIYAGGQFSKLAHFDTINVAAVGKMDGYLVKLSPSGEIRWLRTCVGTGEEYVNKIVPAASGDIYVAGSFEDTATIFGQQFTAPLATRGQNFIAKLDSLGNTLWVKAVGCPTYAAGNQELEFGVDLADNIYFAADGYTECYYDQINISNPGRVTYYGKLDPQGNLQWLRHDSYTNSNSQHVQFMRGIAVADNGDAVVTGYAASLGTVDFCNPYSLPINSYFTIHSDAAGNCVCFEKFKHFTYLMEITDDEMWLGGGYFYELELDSFHLQAIDSNDVEAFVAHRFRNCVPVVSVAEESPVPQLLAYPNPSDGSFSVAPLGENYVQLRILDALGRQILAKSLDPTAPTMISNLPAGIYLLEADGPEFLRMKVVVRK
ncbi:MAG: T9SS type A sorting domain-containing protein [Bacteroidetes bacterium]|nr:T9SS type A sorting domain-containing protein [Bacteroidota bacterium]